MPQYTACGRRASQTHTAEAACGDETGATVEEGNSEAGRQAGWLKGGLSCDTL